MAERSGGTRVAEGEQTRKIERDEKVLRWRSVLERRSRIPNLSPYTGSTIGINPRSLHAQTMETIHWNEKVGLHCRTRGRGVQGGDRLASVCLLTASLSLSISFLLTLFLYLPRSLLPSRLYLLPFVPVGYVRVPDSTLFSSLLSFSLPFRLPLSPTLCCPRLLFFPSAKRRHPRLVFHRPTERKDCKPPDEPRIPEWGLLYSTVFSGCRKSARACE